MVPISLFVNYISQLFLLKRTFSVSVMSGRFICTICGESYSTRGNLKSHHESALDIAHRSVPFDRTAKKDKLDSGGRQFRCDWCANTELSAPSMRRHQIEQHRQQYYDRLDQVFITSTFTLCVLYICRRYFVHSKTSCLVCTAMHCYPIIPRICLIFAPNTMSN